ncbi:MAG: hypothetical protein LN412_07185 [Candidatus Thermoplasmatota archaeon]|nr:hypothetical protein [Candidatus Thermoplasmatota archaeon]
MIRVLKIGPSRVSLLPVIRGLVSEADKVRGAIHGGDYDAVALSISPEELDVLLNKSHIQAPPSGIEEELYMRELRRFGPVEKPPPCFVEAARVATLLHLDCLPLDMDEEEFTELYCREVSGLEMIRESRNLKRLPDIRFDMQTPEELVIQLDATINRYKGRRRVEEAREAHIASTLSSLCREEMSLIALVEWERFDGVYRRLQRSASRAPPDYSELPKAFSSWI